MSRFLPLIPCAVVFLFVAVSIAVCARAQITLPIDSYFYLAKAESLAAGRGLVLNWGEGIDRLFFPGYSVYLALFALAGEPGGFHWLFANLAALAGIAFALWHVAGRSDLGRMDQGHLEQGHLDQGRLDQGRLGRLGQTAVVLGLLTNPSLNRWVFMPYSEILCLLLCMTAWAVAASIRDHPRRFVPGWLLIAGLLAWAVLTRLEALIYVPVLLNEGIRPGAFVAGRRRWMPLASILAAGVIFAVFWALYLPESTERNGERSLRYMQVLEENPVKWSELPEHFRSLALSTVRNHWETSTGGRWAETARVAWAVAAVLAGLLGLLGWRGLRESALFLLFCLGHAFWFYVYDRFALNVLPLLLLVMVRAASRAGEARIRQPRLRLAAALVLMALWTVTNLEASRDAMAAMTAMNTYGGDEPFVHRRIAREVDAALPADRVILTDGGPFLAFYLPEDRIHFIQDGHPFFRSSLDPDDPLGSVDALGITHFVILRQSFYTYLEQWGAMDRWPEFPAVGHGDGFHIHAVVRPTGGPDSAAEP